ncbi:DUF6653 family protein [Sphaerisporangium fuscum]|uniref:DUF6653 family protein n=1 Tax=Sphaerisporangium fuscum TaxID=2835868 RepID=UPI001BDCA3F9|nr:DUF6653 family protein [Sphaerisporangium fuscum]
MKSFAAVAQAFRMTDEAWKRHANPWSVYTRFAAIPGMIVAIWSRTWIGWWSLVPVAAVVVWLWLNPHVFRPVDEPRDWAAKGIYGEKLWLLQRAQVPHEYGAFLRWLIPVGLAGFALLAWGLVALMVWPTVFGATLVVLAQLWRIDRLGLLYEHRQRCAQETP